MKKVKDEKLEEIFDFVKKSYMFFKEVHTGIGYDTFNKEVSESIL